jgi:glycosyltransferase involved in cell wall biosynthesis
MTLLTIGIPTYNRARYLARLLAGLLPAAESLGIEVLVSDNCSTDGTAAVVKEFGAARCLRYFRNPENLGFDRNILNLLDKASGRFLWLMGDDDRPETERLGEVVGLLKANQDTPLFFLNFRSAGPDRKSRSGAGLNYSELEAQSYADRYLHWSTLISTNVINLAAASGLKLNPECVARGWIHVHLLLLLADRLKREGGRVVVVKDRVVVQGAENNITPLDKWERTFVDNFAFTLERTELTVLSIAGFKKRFYDINIRPRYLNFKDIAALAAPREFSRKVEETFHPNIFARASFYLQLKLAGRG